MKIVEKFAVVLALGIAIAGFAYAGFGTVQVTTSETQVLPARYDRTWVILQNNSTNDMWIKMDSSTTAVTTNSGLKLSAGATMSITDSGPARNNIKAISAVGTNTITYSEGNE